MCLLWLICYILWNTNYILLIKIQDNKIHMYTQLKTNYEYFLIELFLLHKLVHYILIELKEVGEMGHFHTYLLFFRASSHRKILLSSHRPSVLQPDQIVGFWIHLRSPLLQLPWGRRRVKLIFFCENHHFISSSYFWWFSWGGFFWESILRGGFFGMAFSCDFFGCFLLCFLRNLWVFLWRHVTQIGFFR